MLRKKHPIILHITFITACFIISFYLIGCSQKKAGNFEPQLSRKAGEPYTNSIGMSFVPIPGMPYAMQTTEVTIGQWFQVMGPPISWHFESRKDDDNYPMTLVTLWEIREFIVRLNSLEKEYVYRLPDAWEWAHACQAQKSSESPPA